MLVKRSLGRETDEESEARKGIQESRDTPFVRAAGLGDTSGELSREIRESRGANGTDI